MTAVIAIVLGGLLDVVGVLALRDATAHGDRGDRAYDRMMQIRQRGFGIGASALGTVLTVIGLIQLLGP